MYTCMYVCHVHHVCMSCNKNKLRNYAYLKIYIFNFIIKKIQHAAVGIVSRPI